MTAATEASLAGLKQPLCFCSIGAGEGARWRGKERGREKTGREGRGRVGGRNRNIHDSVYKSPAVTLF